MKQSRRNSQLFSMAFLDVICCGFGAVVLLVLLSKSSDVGGVEAPDIKSLLLEVVAAERQKTELQRAHDRLSAQVDKLQSQLDEADSGQPNMAGLAQRLAEARERAATLRVDRMLDNKDRAADGAVKVGGIPVDSNYIIFIVDTSGSMQTIWKHVVLEMEHILDIHPQVDGFQVINDNGVYLMKGYKRRWIPDTPGTRKGALRAVRRWNSVSNSSPVEGLQVALRTYAKQVDKLAIYILGDDFSGGSYDVVLESITRENKSLETGEPIARIHGIGFVTSEQTANRFAVLMREVARQNRGAFVGIDLRVQ